VLKEALGQLQPSFVSRCRVQQLQGSSILSTSIKHLQCFCEAGVLWRHSLKQCEAGAEFLRVNVAKDVDSLLPGMSQNRLYALDEAFTQDGVCDVIRRLLTSVDPEVHRHAAVTKALKSRENVPNPVGAFLPACELGERLGVGGRLSVQKAL